MQQFEGATNVRSAFDFEKARLVFRIQRRRRVHQDARTRRERQALIFSYVQPVTKFSDRFTRSARTKANDVVLPAAFFREPLEEEPCVAFVRHHDPAETWIALHKRHKERVHAGCLSRPCIAGEEEVPIHFVARPSEVSERERDFSAIRDDVTARIAHEAIPVLENEQAARKAAHTRCGWKLPLLRYSEARDKAAACDQKREHERRGRL